MAHANAHQFPPSPANIADRKYIQPITKRYSISINPHQHHRDRTACGFLLVPKSKAPRQQHRHTPTFLREALPMLASDQPSEIVTYADNPIADE
jgi:hypothetical protein